MRECWLYIITRNGRDRPIYVGTTCRTVERRLGEHFHDWLEDPDEYTIDAYRYDSELAALNAEAEAQFWLQVKRTALPKWPKVLERKAWWAVYDRHGFNLAAEPPIHPGPFKNLIIHAGPFSHTADHSQ